MIDTIMALWNLIFRRNAAQYAISRPHRFRTIPLVLALFLICISISLLLATIGGAWPALFQHGKSAGNNVRKATTTGLVTTTVQPTQATTNTVPATVTPMMTSTVTTCLGTPTVVSSRPLPASPTADRGQGNGQHGTPTPVATQPGSQPTPPIISVSPIVKITPSSTPTPTMTPSPTPTDSPTPGITPTDTATPTVTPAPSPTDTPSPGVTPTATITTTPGASPTASSTAGIEAPHSGGGPGVSGQQNGNPAAANCLNDNLAIGDSEAVLSIVEEYFWIILSCAILGTFAILGATYRLQRR